MALLRSDLQKIGLFFLCHKDLNIAENRYEGGEIFYQQVLSVETYVRVSCTTDILLYIPELTNWFIKTPKFPQNEVRMERSLKMKVVCTWGFDLKVDYDEVIEVTSLGGSVGVTRKLLVILFSKILPNLAYKIER
jgi:hypothetical protein